MSSHPTEQDQDDRVLEMAFDYCYQVNSNDDNRYSFNQLSVAFISGYEKRSSQIPALVEAAVKAERERVVKILRDHATPALVIRPILNPSSELEDG